MKTIAGSVVDSQPVSLSKAAKILSKFVSKDDNGATPACLHYLMRASDAFAELVQFHKELRGSGSDRKSRRSGVKVEEELVNSVGNYGGVAARETEAGGDVVKKEGDSTIGDSVDSKRRKKEKNKKIKKELCEDGRSNGVKKEEIDPELRENGNVGVVVGAEKKLSKRNGIQEGEIEKKLSKKRKSGEIGVDGEGIDSAKGKQNKKRKKVKSEGGD